MAKQKNRRVGNGMKPRGAKAPAELLPVEVQKPMSADKGQATAPTEAVAGTIAGAQSDSTLALESLQNLDSESVAAFTAADPVKLGLEDLMRDSVDARTDTIGLTGGHTPLSTVGEIFGGPVKVVAPTPISEIEEAIASGMDINVAPNGVATFRDPRMGQQADGSYRSVVTIPEGYLSAVQEWAEAEGKTVEEWIDSQFFSMMEAYGQPAGGR